MNAEIETKFNTKYSDHTRGLRYAFGAALVSGFSIFLNKFAVDAISPPSVYTLMKNTLVLVPLLLVIFVSRKVKTIKSLSKKDILLLILIGIIGGGIPFYLFFNGLALVPSINSAILNKTIILWVALFSWLILKEKINKNMLAAVFILFIGNLLVGGFSGFELSKGELLILLSSVFWAFEYILAQKILGHVEPDLTAIFRFGIGAIILLVLTLSEPKTASIKFGQSSILWLVLVSTLLFGYISFLYRALKYISAVTVASVLVSSTLITNVLSAVFITHSLNTSVLIQSIVIFFGLGLTYYSFRDAKSRKFNYRNL
ncbi:DMT family transporter [Patescibacteria group bacterium]|nr:DMT family transporter [Patescibacteria group bacterium]